MCSQIRGASKAADAEQIYHSGSEKADPVMKPSVRVEPAVLVCCWSANAGPCPIAAVSDTDNPGTQKCLGWLVLSTPLSVTPSDTASMLLGVQLGQCQVPDNT